MLPGAAERISKMDKYFTINRDGCSIRCKLYSKEARSAKRTVIFCHGFGGHKDNHAAARYAEYVLSKNKGTAVVTFDWPCHGEDARRNLRLEDCMNYLEKVCEWAKESLSPEELCAYATSFGGYLLMLFIHERGMPFRKAVLRCPAIPMHEVLDGIVTPDEKLKIEKGKEVLVGFDRKVRMDKQFLSEVVAHDVRTYDYSEYAYDILVIHGTKDEIVPMEKVKAFSEDNFLDFVPIEDADHRFRDPKKMDEAILHIESFFEGKE